MEWKILYKDLKGLNWLILLVLSLSSYLLMAPVFTAGVISGGLTAIANFNLLQHTINGAFTAKGLTKSRVSIIAKYNLRLLGVGVILYVLITKGLVHPVGLALGLSTVVFAIVGIGINLAFKMRTGEAI
ncbi:MAG: ATP synthase subunit I [Deltaproteobacteria bacterium]|nr:ATP synthase subunit I [Deltaproteobacteria bacterium]